MSKRKHISWKTKCAAAVLDGMLERSRAWYDDAKKMTEDQFLSLFQFDHNILHESRHPDRDKFWNLTPKLIRAHREKTKRDAKIIAKGRRIRRQGHSGLILSPEAQQELRNGNPANVLREVWNEAKCEGRNEANEAWVKEATRPGGAVQFVQEAADALSAGFAQGCADAYDRIRRAGGQYSENYDAIDWNKKPKRKIRSRGFDKRFKRKMSGEVVKRAT